jgi:hypothetical protein
MHVYIHIAFFNPAGRSFRAIGPQIMFSHDTVCFKSRFTDAARGHTRYALQLRHRKR